MLLSVREAFHADVAEIAAVRVAAADGLTARFGPGPWSSNATEIGVVLVMKRGRVIVAVRGGAIVGTLTLSTHRPRAINASYFTRVRTPIYLTSMAIAPNAQGQGVGRAMLADAEARARTWPGGPGRAIRLDAFDAVAGAGGFYAKCGYQERSRTVFRNGLSGVAVMHASAMDADRWATALFALGVEEGMAMADAQGLAVVFSTRTPDGARSTLSAKAREMLGLSA